MAVVMGRDHAVSSGKMPGQETLNDLTSELFAEANNLSGVLASIRTNLDRILGPVPMGGDAATEATEAKAEVVMCRDKAVSSGKMPGQETLNDLTSELFAEANNLSGVLASIRTNLDRILGPVPMGGDAATEAKAEGELQALRQAVLLVRIQRSFAEECARRMNSI